MATYSETQTWRAEGVVCPNLACWAKSVLIAAIVSGVAFAMFQMIFTWIARGSFFMPTRMIAGMLLGREALNPAYPLMTAAPLGMGIHMMLSVIFAAIFAAILSVAPSLTAKTSRRILAGAIFGFALWIVNFYLIAPAMGWDWFATQTNPWMQGFVAHVVMFGIPLAWFMKRR